MANKFKFEQEKVTGDGLETPWLLKSIDKGVLVSRGELPVYKHTRVKNTKTCNFNFLQMEKQFSSSPSNEKSGYPSLPDENWGNKKFGFNSKNWEIWEFCRSHLQQSTFKGLKTLKLIWHPERYNDHRASGTNTKGYFRR